jgi:hypothetical protein
VSAPRLITCSGGHGRDLVVVWCAKPSGNWLSGEEKSETVALTVNAAKIGRINAIDHLFEFGDGHEIRRKQLQTGRREQAV